MSDKNLDDVSSPDLDALDASWGDEDDGEDDAPSSNDPGEMDELDALEGGWDAPKRHRTGAERAAARREKARKRAERQKARAAEARAKQKQKQRQARSDAPRPRKPSDAPRARGASRDAEDGSERTEARPVRKARRPPPARKDWQKMAVIVAIVIAVGAGALWLFHK